MNGDDADDRQPQDDMWGLTIITIISHKGDQVSCTAIKGKLTDAQKGDWRKMNKCDHFHEGPKKTTKKMIFTHLAEIAQYKKFPNHQSPFVLEENA